MSFIVAVDGYTGVGKGTLANLLSKKYKLILSMTRKYIFSIENCNFHYF